MDESQPPPPPPPSQGPWGAPEEWGTVAGAAVEQPASMGLAVRLMWVGAANAAVASFIPLLQTDEIREQIEEDNPSFSSSKVDTTMIGGIVLAILLQLVIAGVWLWMARTNGDGKTWARTTATVLGGLNLLLGTLSLVGAGAGVGDPSALTIISTLIGLAIAAAVLFLLYKPESTRFYGLRSGRVVY